MILVAILCTPLLISGLFAGALLAIWRRRREAAHAMSWGAAFAAIMIGWLSVLGTTFVLNVAPLPGATPSLCWLAAALLLVHGLRQRGGRPDRAAALGAIWTGIALAISLLQDLAPILRQQIPATIALLNGIGLLLAAVAVGPRRTRRHRGFDWYATALLVAFGVANLMLVMGLVFIENEANQAIAFIALGSSAAYVALGLVTVLLLNQDFGIALERLARTDPLTGVWNRRGFDEAAPHLIAKLRAEHRDRAAVAIADIDSFKAINDCYGHTTGDAVLIQFAKMLATAIRPGDLLARLGGEEFVLMAMGVDALELYQRVEHVRGMVALPNEDGVALPSITASFGVAQLSAETLSLRDAMERADRSLYQAKREGRNRTVIDHWPPAMADGPEDTPTG
ncbi:MAG: GGDEF domain-containing protein [Sphingomonas sp.]|nr:GGDEF domain-containing protein [Sphingomonas sp.]